MESWCYRASVIKMVSNNRSASIGSRYSEKSSCVSLQKDPQKHTHLGLPASKLIRREVNRILYFVTETLADTDTYNMTKKAKSLKNKTKKVYRSVLKELLVQ